VYDLTVENVDRVLDDVRPYLISDGGNVDVVSVEDGVISLQLQGLSGKLLNWIDSFFPCPYQYAYDE
jgi:NifU-like domain